MTPIYLPPSSKLLPALPSSRSLIAASVVRTSMAVSDSTSVVVAPRAILVSPCSSIQSLETDVLSCSDLTFQRRPTSFPPPSNSFHLPVSCLDCRRACPTTLSLYIYTLPLPFTRAPTRDPRFLFNKPERSRGSPSPGRLVHGKRRLGSCRVQAVTGYRLGVPLSREEGGYPCSSTQMPSPLVRRRQWWI
jgi:hypothetical protein